MKGRTTAATLVVCLLGFSMRAWAGDASDAFGGTYEGRFCVCYPSDLGGGVEDYGTMTWQVSDEGVVWAWMTQWQSCNALIGSGDITPTGTYHVVGHWTNEAGEPAWGSFPVAGTACTDNNGVGLVGNLWFPHLNERYGLWGLYVLDNPASPDFPPCEVDASKAFCEDACDPSRPPLCE